MTRSRLLAFVIAASLPTVRTAQAGSTPTPASITASIHRHGAKATIAALAKADQWDRVADKMGEGDARWIALAPRLAPGSDAGSAEDLGISLAFSLPKNPLAVLAAIDPANGHILGVHRVCGMPFIEDTVKDRPGYRRRALAAVSATSAPMLARVRASCLRELRRAA